MKEPRDPKGPGRSVPAPRHGETPGETSDLVDLKAIAASTRAGATPPPQVTAAELSGVVARRDSVVGMRVSEGSGVPPLLWGVVGCLGVMALGLGIFWYLSTQPGNRATAATVKTINVEPLPGSVPSGPQIVPLPSRPEPAPVVEAPRPEKPVRRKPVHTETTTATTTVAAQAPALAKAEAPAKPTELDRILARGAGSEPGTAAKPTSGGGETAAADPDKAARDVDAALDSLQSKVRQCFRRFQIRGVAAVNLTVTPSGAIQSPALTGDFDGTPTGDCVLKELASASVPPFRGGAMRIAHEYVFR